jgi:tRNA-modifying protein YgfZ
MLSSESGSSVNFQDVSVRAWYLPLSNVAVTVAAGADAARFLQGQLSCNVQKLSHRQALRGSLCNLKGRVITDLMLIQGNDGVLILNWNGMQSKLLSTLDKYKVFFKTSLVAADPAIQILGLGGDDHSAIEEVIGFPLPAEADQVEQSGAITVVRLPGKNSTRFLALTDNRIDSGAASARIRNALAELPEHSWQLADIRDGIVHIHPQQSEVYTPQLLNYDTNGIIDFKKGCYTGQEVVARMHYRAEAKRRLYHLKADSPETFASTSAQLSAEDIVVQQQLRDGSIESLVVLPVNQASEMPGISPL